MNILFIGDVFGQPGRDALLARLPGIVEERAIDMVIANGENAANGAGITSKLALRLLDGGEAAAMGRPRTMPNRLVAGKPQYR